MDDPSDGEFGSESELVAGLKTGSEAAFRRLAEELSRRYVPLVKKHFGNHEDAEEIVNAAALKIITRIQTFTPGRERTFWSWVFRIVMNSGKDRYRRDSRRAVGPMVALDEVEEAALGVATPALAGQEIEPRPSPRSAAIQRAVQRLGERDRMILELHFLAEMSDEAIADKVGTRPDNVRKYRSRAISRLRGIVDGIPELRGLVGAVGGTADHRVAKPRKSS